MTQYASASGNRRDANLLRSKEGRVDLLYLPSILRGRTNDKALRAGRGL